MEDSGKNRSERPPVEDPAHDAASTGDEEKPSDGGSETDTSVSRDDGQEVTAPLGETKIGTSDRQEPGAAAREASQPAPSEKNATGTGGQTGPATPHTALPTAETNGKDEGRENVLKEVTDSPSHPKPETPVPRASGDPQPVPLPPVAPTQITTITVQGNGSHGGGLNGPPQMSPTERSRLEGEIKRHYRRYTVGSWWWASVHHATPYFSAVISVAVALILKLDVFADTRNKTDIAAVLVIVAALLTIFRIAADSNRKWRLYRISRDRLDALRGKLTDPKAQGDVIRSEMLNLIEEHAKEVIGP